MSGLGNELDRAWDKVNSAFTELFDVARKLAVDERPVVSVRIETDKSGKPKNGIARVTVNRKKWRAILRWEQEP